MIQVDITNRQRRLPIDRARLEAAVRRAVEQVGRKSAEVSLAIVNDTTIAELHGRYLDAPTPTDVLSFMLERDAEHLGGEVIVSAETALRSAARYGWSPADELLLYVVHGVLHLAGYLDGTPEHRKKMRKQERAVLAHFGLHPCYRAHTASNR